MTILYDEPGLAYDPINWTYDGDEIIYSLDPVRIITRVGIARAFNFSGNTVTYGGTGKSVLPILGKQTVISTITGRATPQTAQGVAVAYSFNGSA